MNAAKLFGRRPIGEMCCALVKRDQAKSDPGLIFTGRAAAKKPATSLGGVFLGGVFLVVSEM